jgi:D-alanyl-D-alanine carboxypeptidase/D-alanyl-D-alanine-endopeptidase (penicillin-binding protein 4)
MRVPLRSILAILVWALSLPTPEVAHSDEQKTSDPLAKKITAAIEEGSFKNAHWGILIVDRQTGDVVFEHQPDKMFAPASTTKLFSTAAALDALGADYRFETPVYANGKRDGERLLGNLILVASGDLTLGGRTDESGHIAFSDSDHIYAQFSTTAELTKQDPLAGLNALAKQVAKAGIKHVAGDVLIDDRLFEEAESSGSGPERVTPIMVNDNLVDFVIEPTEPGKPAKVTSRPECLALRIDVHVETVAEKEETAVTVVAAGESSLVVRGKIAAKRKPLVRTVEVADPPSFARALFIEALQRAGVRVDASSLAGNDPHALPKKDHYKMEDRVSVLESPPFSENAKLILKVSHNLHASTLPLLIAAKNGERTLNDGMRRQHDFFHRAGCNLDGISFGGAAGGARADYVSPRATVQLLRFMSEHKAFEAFRAGLPVLGVDGTLVRAVPADSKAKGKVAAKTGTLLWGNSGNGQYILTSKALAGYATAANGRELAFAMFLNNMPIAKSEEGARAAGEKLGELSEIMVAETPEK